MQSEPVKEIEVPAATKSTSERSRSWDASVQCPNCFAKGMDIVYELSDIPVHSTINMPDAQSARKFPTGDLRLGYCPRCAFLANTVYDNSTQEYCTQCEESQHASPTFTKFAQTLAQRWIDRYNIRGKRIVEVGCGKGEFLVLMCEMGDNWGVGIDPTYQPWRTNSPAADRLEFIQDYYSEKYTHIPCDVIMCRHTLEHIHNTGEFLSMIRRTIGDRKDMLVLFELPDVTRILREGAFWDIYYEHCSYFSPGSLARLFRQAGFELLELERDYADQYLLIAGKPTDVPTVPKLPLENDLSEMDQLVSHFRSTVQQSISNWRKMITDAVARGEKVVLWSALSKAVSFLTTTKTSDLIEYAVDINPHRQNKHLASAGAKIVSPDFLKTYKPDHVILMNPIYIPEVQRDLDSIGVRAKLWAVGKDF